jgi:hypothetical protein
MDQKLRFEQLLSDEDFQKDVLGMENSETVAPETILANYSISEKQLQTARRFSSKRHNNKERREI